MLLLLLLPSSLAPLAFPQPLHPFLAPSLAPALLTSLPGSSCEDPLILSQMILVFFTIKGNRELSEDAENDIREISPFAVVRAKDFSKPLPANKASSSPQAAPTAGGGGEGPLTFEHALAVAKFEASNAGGWGNPIRAAADGEPVLVPSVVVDLVSFQGKAAPWEAKEDNDDEPPDKVPDIDVCYCPKKIEAGGTAAVWMP